MYTDTDKKIREIGSMTFGTILQEYLSLEKKIIEHSGECITYNLSPEEIQKLFKN